MRNPDCVKYNLCLANAARNNQRFDCERCHELEVREEEGFRKYEHELEKLNSTDRPQDDQGKEETMAVLKECRNCGKEAHSAEEVDALFPKNKLSKGGYETICKECKNKQAQDRNAAKKAGTYMDKRKEKQRSEVGGQKSESRHSMSNTKRPIKKEEGTCLMLDVSNWPEVMEALEEAAKEDIRRPEEQAIAYIIEGLRKDEKLPIWKGKELSESKVGATLIT